ncbi:MAG: monovalent cation/H(+) antiporter subunit G [Flavobacterium sp.]
MSDILIYILCSFGAIFILLAGIGIVRMPDLYLRISVTTKAATLGIGLILIAAGIYFNDSSITTRVLAIILFMFLTAPVGAHLIGRSSYFTGVKLWKKTLRDDLEGKYEKKTHALQSDVEEEEQKA